MQIAKDKRREDLANVNISPNLESSGEKVLPVLEAKWKMKFRIDNEFWNELMIKSLIRGLTDINRRSSIIARTTRKSLNLGSVLNVNTFHYLIHETWIIADPIFIWYMLIWSQCIFFYTLKRLLTNQSKEKIENQARYDEFEIIIICDPCQIGLNKL